MLLALFCFRTEDLGLWKTQSYSHNAFEGSTAKISNTDRDESRTAAPLTGWALARSVSVCDTRSALTLPTFGPCSTYPLCAPYSRDFAREARCRGLKGNYYRDLKTRAFVCVHAAGLYHKRFLCNGSSRCLLPRPPVLQASLSSFHTRQLLLQLKQQQENGLESD